MFSRRGYNIESITAGVTADPRFTRITIVAAGDDEILEQIEKQVAKGKTSVEILHLPYESYLWTSTPEQEPWIERYKLFYGLPEDLELKAVWEYSKKK